MGIFDGAKGAIIGKKAYKNHVDGNKLAGEGKPREAGEKYRTALQLYAESVRLGNADVNVLLSYSLLLMREGEMDRARDLMLDLSRQKTLTKDQWFQLRFNYSIYQWKMGEYDKAIETIGRAAEYRMNGNIYSTLGMFWVDKARQTGDFKAAMDFNLKALDYDDEDASTLDNMGQLYEAMAEREASEETASEYRVKALDYYRKAHKQKPRQITTLYSLAKLYHRAGDDDRARKLLSVKDTLYFSAICPVTREMMEDLAKQIG